MSSSRKAFVFAALLMLTALVFFSCGKTAKGDRIGLEEIARVIEKNM